jgi:hypothetical protein
LWTPAPKAAGTFFFGMLADASNDMLWARQLTPVHRALIGIDGITFLNGTLYVNNVISNNLCRMACASRMVSSWLPKWQR